MIKSVEVKINFDGYKPSQTIHCGFGMPLTYDRMTMRFQIGETKICIPDIPAWVCPKACPRREAKECIGELQLLEGSVGDKIIAAAGDQSIK